MDAPLWQHWPKLLLWGTHIGILLALVIVVRAVGRVLACPALLCSAVPDAYSLMHGRTSCPGALLHPNPQVQVEHQASPLAFDPAITNCRDQPWSCAMTRERGLTRGGLPSEHYPPARLHGLLPACSTALSHPTLASLPALLQPPPRRCCRSTWPAWWRTFSSGFGASHSGSTRCGASPMMHTRWAI